MKVYHYYEKVKNWLQTERAKSWLKLSVKTYGLRVWGIVRTNPVVSILVASILALILFAWITGWEGSLDTEKYDRRQDEIKQKLNDYKTSSAVSEMEAGLAAKEADKAEKSYEQKKDKINEKRKQTRKTVRYADDAGKRDIPDRDVPDNFELCTRANRLGVRCDFDG